MSYYASKCKYCQRQILWVNAKPHDANLCNELYFPGALHFLTCPNKIKEREQRECPICRINALETVEQKFDVDMTKDICRVHRVKWDYGKLLEWKRKSRKQLKKDADLSMLKSQNEGIDTFIKEEN